MEHTYKLIERAQKGDEQAKAQLFQENNKLIWSIVKRFYGRGEAEDLFQIGAIGLLKCIQKFDCSYDVKFSTYAVPMIIGEIRRFLRDDGTIKVSRSLKELAQRAKYLQIESIQTANKELSISELAEKLNTEKEELILALESTREIESIDNKVENEKNGFSLLEQLSDPITPEKTLEHLILKSALENLEPKERQLIVLRFFHDKTQSDVAGCMGISQVQVSRMEKRILVKIRQSMQ